MSGATASGSTRERENDADAGEDAGEIEPAYSSRRARAQQKET